MGSVAAEDGSVSDTPDWIIPGSGLATRPASISVGCGLKFSSNLNRRFGHPSTRAAALKHALRASQSTVCSRSQHLMNLDHSPSESGLGVHRASRSRNHSQGLKNFLENLMNRK